MVKCYIFLCGAFVEIPYTEPTDIPPVAEIWYAYSSVISWSTMIRPQFSQTMIFLRWRISSWRCGGTLLKQPLQAFLSIGTTAKPLRAFLRIRLNAVSRRLSIPSSRFFADTRRSSSSFLVSTIIWSSSVFLSLRSSFFSSMSAERASSSLFLLSIS